ncbi:SDR family oxidoreductase [Gordonia sp. HY002]|uniref:SDR family oxidoreductase n=1 Tax=Gordonia zhenghanii TaxID=2911516 RepID=UPI001EF04F85|nr:SDR family oxidoreductase [Gordonia zhenghanii]MCF8569942.1 SDR family oxidoreductase [Gordonia zhenghanii]MCF8605101.1 SDR family oxidoreductase [Gordonia zhenghanii]
MDSRRTILVTGASRGIGAETARLLAERGNHVVINYREKRKRAEDLVSEIAAAGGLATAIQADLSKPADVSEMLCTITKAHGGIDGLVLNASGGLERGTPDDYPMAINRDAQAHLLDAALPHLRATGRVVFVTSHQAHFVDRHEVPKDYEPVAVSKRAGEDVIRERLPVLLGADVGLSIVSGDMIEGTIIVRLLERRDPNAVDARRSRVPLPTVEQFARAVADEAVRRDLVPRTLFIGGSDYLAGSL